jgi:hypothetical protein
MRRTSVSHPNGLTRNLLRGTVTLVAGLMTWSSASAVDFGNPTQGIGGSLDTTMTYGSTWRVQSPDNAIICTSNGGNSRSCNYDDGTQNYDTGQVQNLFKFVTELSMSYQDRFGIFTRASGFYDTKADETERTSLTSDATDKVEKSFDWLDAYAWANFDVGNMPAQVRVGRQVVNWGESTFYVTGLSSLNHFDISKLRGAAVNLREGLKPQQQVYFTISPTENLSIEAFYQYHWSDTKPEPAATLYSTNDFATEGGKFVMLGFGAWGDLGTDLARAAPVRQQARRRRPVRRGAALLLPGPAGRHRVRSLLRQLPQPPAGAERRDRHAGRLRQFGRRSGRGPGDGSGSRLGSQLRRRRRAGHGDRCRRRRTLWRRYHGGRAEFLGHGGRQHVPAGR